MKRCPRCNRTYFDEYAFCVEDGAVLSAPYNTQKTLVIATPNNSDLPTIKGVVADKEIVSTKSTGKRRRWNDISFFEEAVKNLKTDEVEKLRRLYKFSIECGDRIKWGTGTQRGTFNVVFDLFSPSKSLYTVYSDGNLELNFAWLQPENQRAVLILNEFAQSLKKLRGFNISSDFRKSFITVRKEYWMLQINEFTKAFIKIEDYQLMIDSDE